MKDWVVKFVEKNVKRNIGKKVERNNFKYFIWIL